VEELIESGEIKLEVPESSYNVSFRGKDGKEVGRLEWDDGKMAFKGKMEESAQVFFNWLLETLINPYIEKKLGTG